MSFSWSIRDKDESDLLKEFNINEQALGLGSEYYPHSVSSLRAFFIRLPYKSIYEQAARDAVEAVQAAVAENIRHYEGPEHPDCPCCTCNRKPLLADTPFGMDMEQAKRFVSIPLNRVYRAGGGY